MNNKLEVSEIAEAIYTVNRHAKTAPEPQHLYMIKKKAIDQLLEENKAEKIGLHFSNNPRLSNQHSTLLVKVANYYFHVPPSKDDFKKLKHLGSLDNDFRNPKTKMSLSYAKKIIYQYINWKSPKEINQKRVPSYYTPSSLGKMEWPPTKKFYIYYE
ncbi:YkyB family protein [Pseudogracilibacillus sp. SE30717A]|uniref:YkyB family protein n=1 Tax=Pseudogracilibacillus sp. SE30717A TaxID=3098293 RepID=UPI00300E5AB0